jgi:ATPase subunit of ABC transporter with duplicated ATPase domains
MRLLPQESLMSQSVLLECAHLCAQSAAGEHILQDIQLSLTAGRYGLCGRNGSGKSWLLELLAGQRQAQQGHIRCGGRCAWLPQQQADAPRNAQGLADYLNLSQRLQALQRVEEGMASAADFELIGDDWSLPQRLQQILLPYGLAYESDHKAAQLMQRLQRPAQALSGGQRMRLQLALLFASEPAVLLLDEPGNHLDDSGRQWLIGQMAAFRGVLILVSHDVQLLQAMEHILELRSGHLYQYGGNYEQFLLQRQQEQQALLQQLEGSRQRLQQVERATQRSQEKAARRAQSGKRERRDGSQSKLLLDNKQQSAEQQQGRQSRARSRQHEQAAGQLKERQQQWQQEDVATAQWYLPATAKLRSGLILQITDQPLPYRPEQRLTFAVQQGEHLWLRGDNGSGKSSLLQLLAAADQQPTILRRTEIRLLDQHCSLLHNHLSALDNLQQATSLDMTSARTLLAGVGLNADACLRPAGILSGGERMKLALLMVTQQTPGALLLLDEPDNHLDRHSREQLAQALRAYPGALILVSHDGHFAAGCGISQTLML